MPTSPQTDRVLRAMTDDGSFRVMTLRATDTVRAVVAAQEVHGPAASQLGEIVSAAVLVRETMAPGNRVQVLLRDGLGSQLVGDAHPEGRTRGLARVVDDVLGARFGADCLLQVVRIMRAGKQHEGLVETVDEGGVPAALRRYFLLSEQITTMVDLTCVQEDGEVVAVGGFVVQLLPEVTEPPLAQMKAQLDRLGDLETRLEACDADPERLMNDILNGFPSTALAESGVCFSCLCDPDRATGAVATLGREEIEELIDAGETLSVTCDYCRSEYGVDPDQLRTLLRDRED